MSHFAVEVAAENLCIAYSKSFMCLIGGNYVMTAWTLRGIKNVYPQERIGVIQLNTHLDVHNHVENERGNKSPIH